VEKPKISSCVIPSAQNNIFQHALTCFMAHLISPSFPSQHLEKNSNELTSQHHYHTEHFSQSPHHQNSFCIITYIYIPNAPWCVFSTLLMAFHASHIVPQYPFQCSPHYKINPPWHPTICTHFKPSFQVPPLYIPNHLWDVLHKGDIGNPNRKSMVDFEALWFTTYISYDFCVSLKVPWKTCK
jgi:hypothetical protein